jgi:hypothetical protein
MVIDFLPARLTALPRLSPRAGNMTSALPKNVAARPRALLLQGICRTFRLNGRPAARARLDGLRQTEVQPLPS